jgi:transcriptional regulator with XRE-family HTH domain
MPRAAGFGPFLRQLRTERGSTAADIAVSAGVSTSYLLRLERGEVSNPSLSLVRRLASALEVDVEALTRAGRSRSEGKASALSDEVAAIVRTLPDTDAELVREVARLLQRRARKR